jgi:enoyl-CoA hydratase/carnithine racemase
MPEVTARRDGPIGRVVIAHPEKLNAMNLAMWEALPPLLQALDADPEVRLVVIEGEGERAFVAGGDISEFESQRDAAESRARYDAAVETAYLAPGRCGKPVVAKIRGICMGGGLGLAAACDLRFCTDDSRFRMPAARLGLGYGAGGVDRFLTVLGLQNTLDVFFSARVFDAADALRMGFVSRVEPRASFDAAVDAWCTMVAENAPLTLRAVKLTTAQLVRDGAERDMAAAKAAIAACFASDDHLEGARAFMQKRTPVFTGR